MMKKAISLFLAVSVLCIATSAMATPTTSNLKRDTSYDPRNGVTSFSGGIPCFRSGDTISFNVGSVTSGRQLTLISYKSGETPNNSNVVYINQYELESSSQDISYKIPATTATGTYVIKINDEEATAATFTYKVGNIKAELIEEGYNVVDAGEFGTPYRIVNRGSTYSVAFIGKVTIQGGNLELTDLGATPGFIVRDKVSGETQTTKFGDSGNPTVSEFQKSSSDKNNLRSGRRELTGEWSFVYGLTIYNITAGSTSDVKVEAAAILD